MCRWILLPLAVLLSFLIASPAPAAETAEELQKRARKVLASLNGEHALPGLRQPVEVLRDRWGVAHIYARNQDDLFFAQGFVAAQDRLFQMDMWRRVGVGETAEVLGRDALPGDRFARLLKYRGDMDAEWNSYSPDARAIATAFTAGINAYIDSIGDRLPIEFQILGTRPRKWKPEDCLGRMSGVIMARNFRDEVARAELVAAVGPRKARRLAPVDPPVAYAPAPGLDLAGIDRKILAGYQAATGKLKYTLASDGSNNWAIDGTLSVSRKPMLASDPHRTLGLPSLRYLVHLHAPGWNVIGSGEPGLPGVAIGHNDHIAWGFTIVGTDQSDLYVEETRPGAPTEYRVGEGWEKMKVLRAKVRVRGERAPVEVELRFTRHGPVIYQDEKRRRAYALRWVGSEPGTAAYLGSLAVGRAGNWREYLDALKAWKLPSENMMYADVEGNIGWVASALTPVRKGWHGLLPVPGAGGRYEWQGFLAVKDLPQAFNSPAHFLATSNHNILPPGYRHHIANEWAPPYRFLRVRQRLRARKRFTLEDFQSIQHDNTTLPGQALVRLLGKVKLNDPDLEPYARLLRSWDGVLSRDSHAGPLYALWLRELLDGLYRPHVPQKLLPFLRSKGGVPVLLGALQEPDPFWFGKDPAKGRDRLVRETFRRAVADAQKRWGKDPKRWRWGKVHRAVLRHPLAGLGPAYARAFNPKPVGRPGDGLTPNATRYNAAFEQVSGGSYRQVLDLADWDRGRATSAPGQSGQPGSPHYADLLPLWAEGRYFPLAFSRDRVEDVKQHRLVLRPAGKEGR
jgi:penicillin amidase